MERCNLFPYPMTRIRWCVNCGILMLGTAIEKHQKQHAYCTRECYADQNQLQTEREWAYLKTPVPPTVTELFDAAELKHVIQKTLRSLPERPERIMRLWFGFDDENPRKLAEIARIFGISAGRVQQIKEEALRRLRHQAETELEPFFTPRPVWCPESISLTGNDHKLVVLARFFNPNATSELSDAITELLAAMTEVGQPTPTLDTLKDAWGRWLRADEIRNITRSWKPKWT